LASAAIARSSHDVRCGDGWRLAVEVVSPARPLAVVIAGHAMMVDRRTLDVGPPGEGGLVSELSRRGLAVVWPDLRGHGRSGPLAAEGGRWSYDELVEHDVPALAAFAGERFPGLPLAAVGHSLFGHAALGHALLHPGWRPAALVLLAANVWMRRCEPRLLRWLAKRALVEAGGVIAEAVGYFPTRRLRIGSADEALPYYEQLRDCVRANDWRTRDGRSYLAQLPSLGVPLLAIAGAGDRLLGDPRCTARFVGAAPGHEHVTVGRRTTVEAGTVGRWQDLALPLDPDHMQLAIDPRCRPLWARIADWVIDRATQPR